jgi:hypothetical protein
VTGPYDVVARVEAASIDALGRLVVSKIQTVEGITRTLTEPPRVQRRLGSLSPAG